jgi:hypothetical protein
MENIGLRDPAITTDPVRDLNLQALAIVDAIIISPPDQHTKQDQDPRPLTDGQYAINVGGLVT